MKKYHALIVLLTLGLLAASRISAHAQTIDSRYFSESGHNVNGDFLRFYESNPHALVLYGYPITEEFTSRDGKTVQYFQRARFEYHSELPEGQRVLLTPLGRATYASNGPLDVSGAFACRTYAETGYAVCFAFLEFYDAYGGVAQFGYPISSFEYHEDKIVQYFENARLEWQPSKPEGQRVVVYDLGRVYFGQLDEDPGLLPPVKPRDNTTVSIVRLQVRAFAWKAVTLTDDSQQIFVIVQDQNLQPVDNANCAVVVHWPGGRDETRILSTNPAGVAVLSLAFDRQPLGSLIASNVTCVYGSLNGVSTTSFRIWY